MVRGFRYGPTRGERDGRTAHAQQWEDVTKAVHTTLDQEPERHEPRPGYLSQVLALVTHSPARSYLPKFPEPPTIEPRAENQESKAVTCQETFHIQTLRGRTELTYNGF